MRITTMLKKTDVAKDLGVSTATEIAFLLVELKKKDPAISEKLSWFIQDLKIAGTKNHFNSTS